MNCFTISMRSTMGVKSASVRIAFQSLNPRSIDFKRQFIAKTNLSSFMKQRARLYRLLDFRDGKTIALVKATQPDSKYDIAFVSSTSSNFVAVVARCITLTASAYFLHKSSHSLLTCVL